MGVLNELVELLSDEKASLNAALLKTTVLLHTIGHGELASWVNQELRGYGRDEPLPEYRVVQCRVVGNIQTAAMIQINVDLPTSHLSETLRNHLTKYQLREAIGVLEQMGNGSGRLTNPLPPEINLQIDKAYRGAHVQKAWQEINPLQVQQALTQVRVRLLDFALNLKGKLGGAEEDAAVKEAAQTIDAPAMFQGAVFGDNATVIVGSHNKTEVHAAVRKGDFDSLVAYLTAKGIPTEDIADLRQAISEDPRQLQEPTKFGPQVRAWIVKMFSKAVETSWQIEVGVAAGLLTEAPKAYYS